ncbi:helix-turn-helix domain-containing protein [Thermodesulfobacteriota bacterium]
MSEIFLRALLPDLPERQTMRTYFDTIEPGLLWRAEDVAEILNLSPKTVLRLVREGRPACAQVTGRERRFTQDQAEGLSSWRKNHAMSIGYQGYRKGARK